MVHVGKYSMHGAYGIYNQLDNQLRLTTFDTLEEITIEKNIMFQEILLMVQKSCTGW